MKKLIIVVPAVVLLAIFGWLFLGKEKAVPSPSGSSDITVALPASGGLVSSPITLSGKALGSWYFEASAPVFVYDSNGKILGQSYITAQGDWMTTEFVPFTGTITFEKSDTKEGIVVFKNDNPSGDESRSKQYVVPVSFR
ncbi:MAG: Gmad2 immunoglobulin-like domain-containing protein [Patescibacteria group bacterium]